MEPFVRESTVFRDPSAMTARVAADAARAYGDRAESAVLDRCAQEAVADLWTDGIRVTSFVPVLALRQVRDHLESRLDSAPQPSAVEASSAVDASLHGARFRRSADSDIGHGALTDDYTLTPD